MWRPKIHQKKGQQKMAKSSTTGKASRKPRNIVRNRKASSMGIVMLLLVLTTLVGGYFYYDMVSGSIENMTTKVNEQMTSLFLKTFNINSSCITSYIANTGLWAIKIVNAYVNQQCMSLERIVEISKDAIEPVFIIGQYMKGIKYTIELVNNFGTSISFDIVYN